MARPPKPARLNWIESRGTYEIRDVGDYRERLGLGRHQQVAAEAKLAEYVRAKVAEAAKEKGPEVGRSARDVTIGEVLAYYCDDHAELTKRPAEVAQKAAKLLAFWGDKATLADVSGVRCKAFRKTTTTPYARECLSTLRAAIRLFALDRQLVEDIKVWMPRSLSRARTG